MSQIFRHYYKEVEDFGRLEDKDFSALAPCSICLFSSPDGGAYGARYNSTANVGEAEGQKIGPELILFFAILMLVPLVMAFLSLTLKDSINRLVNIIVDTVFAALWFVGVVDAAQSAYWGGALMTLSAVVASALIVWFAWKSNRKLESYR